MDFLVRIPFVEMLGLKLQRFEPGVAEVLMPMRDELTNSWSVMHGGATMTLLDVAMAHAARSPHEGSTEPQPGVVTVEMKTSFMRPGVGDVLARGTLLHRTASMAFCEGSVFDPKGQLVAHATATFKFMRGLAVGGRKIHRLNASD